MVHLVPVITLVAVVTAKVKFTLFPNNDNTDCSDNGSYGGFSQVGNVTVVKMVAVVTLLAVVTGNGGNRHNIGFSVHGYTE